MSSDAFETGVCERCGRDSYFDFEVVALLVCAGCLVACGKCQCPPRRRIKDVIVKDEFL